MDNTLKMILGVLGVSGVLAMLVPSGNPVASKTTIAEQAATPASETISVQQVDESVSPQSDDNIESQMIQMGQPTMNGLPVGQADNNDGGNASSETSENSGAEHVAQPSDGGEQREPAPDNAAASPAPIAAPPQQAALPQSQTPAAPARPSNWL